MRFCFLLLFTVVLHSQNIVCSDSRIFETDYKNEKIQILISSKKGDENIKKPLILYIQGSLARPLIINYPEDNNYKYSLAFPFDTKILLNKYHLAVVSKPFIPVTVDVDSLNKQFEYIQPKDKKIPVNFLKNNNLNYYKKRFKRIVNYLNSLSFVKKNNLIVLGHSEGSRIAFAISKQKPVKALIYLSGNPFGRYMNIVQRNRLDEKDTDFLKKDRVFDYWKKIKKNKDKNNYELGGDTYVSWYLYSKPYFKKFLKIKKNVFIGYGTKDFSAPYNDLFKFYVLLKNKTNFNIQTYQGLEHSFYKMDETGKIHHDKSYFNLVIQDVLKWLIPKNLEKNYNLTNF